MARPLPPPTVVSALAIGPSLGTATRVIPPVVSAESGTTYTMILLDDGLWKQFTAATAVTVTIPPNSSVAFPINAGIIIQQYGAGQVTIVAGAGVTLQSAGGLVATAAQYAVCQAFQVATNTWVLFGNLA